MQHLTVLHLCKSYGRIYSDTMNSPMVWSTNRIHNGAFMLPLLITK